MKISTDILMQPSLFTEPEELAHHEVLELITQQAKEYRNEQHNPTTEDSPCNNSLPS